MYYVTFFALYCEYDNADLHVKHSAPGAQSKTAAAATTIQLINGIAAAKKTEQEKYSVKSTFPVFSVRTTVYKINN